MNRPKTGRLKPNIFWIAIPCWILISLALFDTYHRIGAMAWWKTVDLWPPHWVLYLRNFQLWWRSVEDSMVVLSLYLYHLEASRKITSSPVLPVLKLQQERWELVQKNLCPKFPHMTLSREMKETDYRTIPQLSLFLSTFDLFVYVCMVIHYTSRHRHYTHRGMLSRIAHPRQINYWRCQWWLWWFL